MLRVEQVEVPEPHKPSRRQMEDHFVLYVTNQAAMARIDLGKPLDPDDKVGPIPAVALKHMEKGVNARLREESIEVGTITSYTRAYSEEKPSREDFPDVDKIQAMAEPPKPKRAMTLDLSPELLNNLAAAMGAGYGVKLVLDEEEFAHYTAAGMEEVRWYKGAIKVEAREGHLAGRTSGVMMPIRPRGA